MAKKFIIKALKEGIIFEAKPNIFLDMETGKKVSKVKDIIRINKRLKIREKEIKRLRGIK